MSDFDKIEREIEGLACAGSVLPVGTSEAVAKSMRLLLDVARAAQDRQWHKELLDLVVESKLSAALTALQEHLDE